MVEQLGTCGNCQNLIVLTIVQIRCVVVF